MNRWEVHNAIYTNTNKHVVRPVIVVNEDDTYVYTLLCGHDEVVSQTDGSQTTISYYYDTHPEHNIDPVILTDWKDHGFNKPSYANVHDLKKILKTKVDSKVNGTLSKADIAKLEPFIDGLSISEALLSFIV